MSIVLRPYQQRLKHEVLTAWSGGSRYVLVVAPTGSGKTVAFADLLSEYKGASCAIAHRQELVSQISLALARVGVRHGLMAPQPVIREIVSLHMSEVGRSYYDPGSPRRVAGVDTLIRMPVDEPWFRQVGLWIMDEAHHVLKANKWGRAVSMFPNAHGAGFTATPCRADGKGLGDHNDGVFHTMVLGPPLRQLIDEEYLSDYRLIAPPNRVQLKDVPISAGGDYSPVPLVQAVRKARIVGDVVQQYLKHASGKLGVTFAVSVEDAGEIAQAYRDAGVPAEVVSAETPIMLRAQIIRRFRARQVLQLVNVDLFGEGFDLPAIEVVTMARPTQSEGLYKQQFGRALRVMEGKDCAIVIDHVENYLRHGLPDRYRNWSLDRRGGGRNAAPDAIPLRNCLECFNVYERVRRCCPYCGHYPQPAGRSLPAQVDGDLFELSPEVLASMRGEIQRIDSAPQFPVGAGPAVQQAIRNAFRERQNAQHHLRQAMSMWGGARTAAGDDIPTAQRRFFHQFGVDVATAQTLGAREADELKGRLGV